MPGCSRRTALAGRAAAPRSAERITTSGAQMLNPQRIGTLPIKSQRLGRRGRRLGRRIRASAPRINVTFAAGDSTGGVDAGGLHRMRRLRHRVQRRGEEHGADELPPACARPRLPQIFTEVEVRTVRRRTVIVARHLPTAGGMAGQFAGPTRIVTADAVVLGAGTLGTTEILLRSAARRASRSRSQVGHHFSGNGDVLGFGVRRARVGSTGSASPAELDASTSLRGRASRRW